LRRRVNWRQCRPTLATCDGHLTAAGDCHPQVQADRRAIKGAEEAASGQWPRRIEAQNAEAERMIKVLVSGSVLAHGSFLRAPAVPICEPENSCAWGKLAGDC